MNGIRLYSKYSFFFVPFPIHQLQEEALQAERAANEEKKERAKLAANNKFSSSNVY